VPLDSAVVAGEAVGCHRWVYASEAPVALCSSEAGQGHFAHCQRLAVLDPLAEPVDQTVQEFWPPPRWPLNESQM
jgi:hypothetical protein